MCLAHVGIFYFANEKITSNRCEIRHETYHKWYENKWQKRYKYITQMI